RLSSFVRHRRYSPQPPSIGLRTPQARCLPHSCGSRLPRCAYSPRYGADMIVIRFIVNAAILSFELGLVAASAWLGLHYPLIFAALTASLALGFGLVLEHARLRNELGFYFGQGFSGNALFIRFMALIDAVVKALLAGLMALLTFTGTDQDRLIWVAVFFGTCVFAGSSLLRRLSSSLDA